MSERRKLSRRSFLASVAGAAAAGGALALVAGEAKALQVTDRDPSDPAGRGRGITDRDAGPRADPAGRGRGQGTAGDSDYFNARITGDVRRTDPPPFPRTGISDRDQGPMDDPFNHGRGRRRAGPESCAAVRRRIEQLDSLRPRAPQVDWRIDQLEAMLNAGRCRRP